jgi:hypothetical protein
MQITRSSIETQKGPADWFTGAVYIDEDAVPAGSSTFAAATPNSSASCSRRAPEPGTTGPIIRDDSSRS